MTVTNLAYLAKKKKIVKLAVYFMTHVTLPYPQTNTYEIRVNE
jgi:hypothetical protein